ncbi:hypothetical protein K1T71_008155 [Dendrolimus kikuchii]|uniref:Uncharacterized protein n=1 Tax=Dendrolimus kikuchii TaxID=765133 RepID=A0ACC1CW88_9NEOP|nr:hypothetical protein K1T71_008155 [Dendrolimus kikuchii]
MVSRLFIIALVACIANAATWIDINPKKPPKEFAGKKGCYIEEMNDVIPFGTEITPKGRCYRVHCSEGMLDYASCGVIMSADPKCHETEPDYSKPYPDCCPTFKCDDENKID